MSSGSLTTWKKTGKSWFFGIGINQYVEFTDLTNAVRDVKKILEILLDSYDIDDAHVHTLYNEQATEERIIEKLDFFAKHVKPEDKLIIYYSGHGRVNNDIDMGYWLPHDAKKSSSSRYVLNSTIQDYVGGISAKHILLISDACFSGTMFMRGDYRSADVSEDLESHASRWALCSGRQDEEVYDGDPGGHSPFAQSLLNILSNNNRDFISVSRVANHVIEETAANYNQLPDGRPMFGVGHAGGQYIFRKKLTKDTTSTAQSVQKENKKLETRPIQLGMESTTTAETLSDADGLKMVKWILFTVLGAFIIVGGIIIGTMMIGSNDSGSQNNVNSALHQVQDADGEIYPTTIIGNTEWMAVNMNYISESTVNWSFLEVDKSLKDTKLGLLYSYDGAVSACQKLTGGTWTLPTVQDWEMLATFFGQPLGKINDGTVRSFDSLLAANLVATGNSGLNLQLGGKYLIDKKEYSPVSPDNLNSGHYWIYDQRILNIKKYSAGITAEITSQDSSNHACSCRCVKRN